MLQLEKKSSLYIDMRDFDSVALWREFGVVVRSFSSFGEGPK